MVMMMMMVCTVTLEKGNLKKQKKQPKEKIGLGGIIWNFFASHGLTLLPRLVSGDGKEGDRSLPSPFLL